MLISAILIIIALLIGSLFAWIIDNNGLVVINWLGYEITSDVLTSLLIIIFFLLMTFAVTYLLARILSFRLPFFLKLFSAKQQNKKNKNLIDKYCQAVELLPQLLMALETNDIDNAEFYYKKISQLIDNSDLDNFLLGKIATIKKDFLVAEKLYSKIAENKFSEILTTKPKIEYAIQSGNYKAAISYAKKILELRPEDLETAKLLFDFHKKDNNWQEICNLVNCYGIETFDDNLTKNDLIIINTITAKNTYQKKKFLMAIKYANSALAIDEYYTPALEIKIKSYLKIGLNFRAKLIIKNCWTHCQSLAIIKIYNFINRKLSAEQRITKIKQIAKNEDNHFDNFAIGLIAFKAGDLTTAKKYLQTSLKQQEDKRTKKLLDCID